MGLLDKAIKDGYQAPTGNLLPVGTHLVKLSVEKTKKGASSNKQSPQINAVYENSDGAITDFITISDAELSMKHIIQLIAAMIGKAPEDFSASEFEAMNRHFGRADSDERHLENLEKYLKDTATKHNRAFQIDVVARKYQGKDQLSVSIFPPNDIRAASDSENKLYQGPSVKITESVEEEAPPLP